MGQVGLVQSRPVAAQVISRTPAAVELRRVSKVFAGPPPREVFSDLNISIRPGEFTALSGPIGCGKTTLINLITGAIPPTSGSISVGGIEVAEAPEDVMARVRANEMGVVSQVQNLFDELSVSENIRLPLIFSRLEERSRSSRVAEVLERIGISEYADRRVGELSVGERELVSIARALVSDPPLVLMDEPTESLDPLITDVVLKLLSGDNLTRGKTIVIATHDKKILDLADRTIRIKKKIL